VRTATSSARPVTGAASIQVLSRVAGARRTAPVLQADSDTVLLDLDGYCLAVLGAEAVELPCGVRTPVAKLPPTRAGDLVTIADGVLDLPKLEVLVTHIVDNTVPVLGPEAADWATGHLESVAGDALCLLRNELSPGALERLSDSDPRAVELLIGTGPSGTRLGDDVVAGWLAAAVATRHPALPRMRTATFLAVRDSADLLGATLLGCAARGETVPEFRALLAALDAQDAGAIEAPLDALLSRRTSGGAGLVLGALHAMAGLADRSRLREDLASAG
jgi:hypothetical protein